MNFYVSLSIQILFMSNKFDKYKKDLDDLIARGMLLILSNQLIDTPI